MFRVRGWNIAGTHGCFFICSGARARVLSFAKRSSFKTIATSSYRVMSQTTCLSGRTTGQTGSSARKRA